MDKNYLLNTTQHPKGNLWYGKITLSPIQGECDMDRLYYSPYLRRVWYGKITLLPIQGACYVWEDHTIFPIRVVCEMVRLPYSLFIYGVYDMERLYYSLYTRCM